MLRLAACVRPVQDIPDLRGGFARFGAFLSVVTPQVAMGLAENATMRKIMHLTHNNISRLSPFCNSLVGRGL
jgi:hypothetical protein